MASELPILPTYSPYFKTVHDERPRSNGYLGRGAHYSVIQSLSWFDAHGKLLSCAQEHNLALIWDEDHDERIVFVVEDLYREGLLSSVLFVGERKAVVTIITKYDMPKEYKDKCARLIEGQVSELIGDAWSVCVEPMGLKDGSSIIAAPANSVDIYLRSIEMLWLSGRD